MVRRILPAWKRRAGYIQYRQKARVRRSQSPPCRADRDKGHGVEQKIKLPHCFSVSLNNMSQCCASPKSRLAMAGTWACWTCGGDVVRLCYSKRARHDRHFRVGKACAAPCDEKVIGNCNDQSFLPARIACLRPGYVRMRSGFVSVLIIMRAGDFAPQ